MESQQEEYQANLRAAFTQIASYVEETGQEPQVVIAIVRLPSGALETLVNYHDTMSKLTYYREAYDDLFQLKANPEVRIEGILIR